MKNILFISSLSLLVSGCSNIDYSEFTLPISPKDQQIERILALNLSHNESIEEASKLIDTDLKSSVIKELKDIQKKKENLVIEAENIAVFVDKVKVTNNNSNFIAPKITETRQRGLLLGPDIEDYYLTGIKSENSLTHYQVNFSIKYTAINKRNYSFAKHCDKWQGCKDGEKLNITQVSSNAANCNTSNCEFTEKMFLVLTDEFINKNANQGFAVSFNSNRFSNKISFPSIYLKGLIEAVQN